MSNAISAYIRAVKKHMPCTGAVKQELTAGLFQKMTQCAEENDSVDMQLFYENFGPPAALAAELMREVTPEQKKTYRIQKTVLQITAGVLATIWIAITVYIFCVKSQPLIAYEYVTGHHIGSVE